MKWVYCKFVNCQHWRKIPKEDLISWIERGMIKEIDGETITLEEVREIVERGFSLVFNKNKEGERENSWEIIPNLEKTIIIQKNNEITIKISRNDFRYVLELIKERKINGIKIEPISERELKKICEEGCVSVKLQANK
jgi:hypothetical protein